jgi:hypothetical protein
LFSFNNAAAMDHLDPPLLLLPLERYRYADRSDLLGVVEFAARESRRARFRAATWVAQCVVGHWLSVGFVFLRDDTAGDAGRPLRTAQNAVTDLTGLRRVTHLELIDAADYAAEVTAGLSRRAAGLVVHNIMHDVQRFTVLRDTRVKTEGMTTLTELMAAEAEAQERERKKWPSWDDW